MKRYTFKLIKESWKGVAELDTKEVNWHDKYHVKAVTNWIEEQTEGKVCMDVEGNPESFNKDGYSVVINNYKINITNRCVSIGILKSKCCIIKDN